MADAPRFRAYWERIENRSLLTMTRSDWSALQINLGSPVTIDVTATPMAQVASNASVVKAFVEQGSAATAEIVIIRHDPNDPKPYNQDKYDVWVDVTAHPRLGQMISGASTGFNDNFQRFAAETVFILKQAPGPDHWLDHVPDSASTIITSSGSRAV